MMVGRKPLISSQPGKSSEVQRNVRALSNAVMSNARDRLWTHWFECFSIQPVAFLNWYLPPIVPIH
jgi:hypothetical protein